MDELVEREEADSEWRVRQEERRRVDEEKLRRNRERRAKKRGGKEKKGGGGGMDGVGEGEADGKRKLVPVQVGGVKDEQEDVEGDHVVNGVDTVEDGGGITFHDDD